ncbi:MAG: DUF488 domain-containing protein [Methyloligellaceae bacterium]
MAPISIKLKRVYEPPSDDDGVRILVERLWPRGLSKAVAKIDHWTKDAAPTPALRTWFGHRPERWEEFRERYLDELEENQTAVNAVRVLCERQNVTFVFAARDVERNSAILLREFLLSERE